MSATLIDKIRKAREERVSMPRPGGEGEWVFDVRRPTDAEFLQISDDDGRPYPVACRFTLGWNLREIDIIPGGDASAVEFSSALLAEWAADQPAVCVAISKAVAESYLRHRKARDDAAKK